MHTKNLTYHFGCCEEDVFLGGDEVELGEGEGLEQAAVHGRPHLHSVRREGQAVGEGRYHLHNQEEKI